MELELFILICFLASMIHVIGGFGGTMLAMPFTILIFGAQDAKTLMTGISIVGTLYPVVRYWRHLQFSALKKMLLFMIVGAAAAQLAGPALYSETVLILYGLMVVAVGISSFIPKKEVKLPKAVDNGILFLAGLIHGAFLSGGALLAIYSIKNFKEKDQMRTTISAIWLIINSFVLITTILSGAMTPHLTGMVMKAQIPCILGILLGDYLQSKMDQKKFRTFVNVMLLISGIVLLYNCFFG